MKVLSVLTVLAVGSLAVSAAHADFVAFNDCVVAANHRANAANVTTYGIGSGYTGATSGELKNLSNGAGTGVTATLTQSGSVNYQPDLTTGGDDCAVGTPAALAFNPTLSLQGTIYYGSAVGWYVDLQLSGLNPNGLYEFVTTANRKGGTGSMANKLTKYTLFGADAFTNTSSAGTTIAGASTTFNTYENTAAGYVAQWNGINPGADGVVKFRAEFGGDPAGANLWKAYTFDAFKLTEVVVPEPSSIIALAGGLVGLLGMRLRKV